MKNYREGKRGEKEKGGMGKGGEKKEVGDSTFVVGDTRPCSMGSIEPPQPEPV